MQNRTISFQTTNIIEAEIQVIHVCIVTPVRRLTPSDRNNIYVCYVIEYLITYCSLVSHSQIGIT